MTLCFVATEAMAIMSLVAAHLAHFSPNFMGNGLAFNKGRAGSQHYSAPEYGFFASSSIVAGSVPIAVGAALSCRLRGLPNISVVDFGDGAIEQGVFFEAINFASLHSLPVVFICQNNLYATHAPLAVRQAGKIFG